MEFGPLAAEPAVVPAAEPIAALGAALVTVPAAAPDALPDAAEITEAVPNALLDAVPSIRSAEDPPKAALPVPTAAIVAGFAARVVGEELLIGVMVIC